MKEEDAVAQILDEISATAALPEADVRTVGGDQGVDPPEVVVSWRASRLSGYNGANNLGGFVTDNAGDQTGREYHNYYRFEADVTVRSYDELEAHGLLQDIQDQFTQYEYNSNAFNEDTAEWAVGSSSPRGNPVFEPDWYEIGVPLSFVLLRRVTDTADTLTTVTTSEDIDDSLDDGEVIMETKD